MLTTSPKSGWLVRLYSTSGTLFLLFVRKTCQTLQEYAVINLFTECMDGLFHKITERCIKCGAIK